MTVTKRRRIIHDPWGNKYGNNNHSVIKLQFGVGHKAKYINHNSGRTDFALIIDGSSYKYVISKRNPERIRR
jgi:hypothetical protein